MKNFYAHLERIFEKITFAFTAIISNSITFILVLIMVIFWFANRNYLVEPINEIIRDIIHGIAFLTLFIIQKAFNHFTASLHIKLDELIASNKNANNQIINVESKTEPEIIKLKQEYNELAEQTETNDNKNESGVDESGKSVAKNKTNGNKI